MKRKGWIVLGLISCAALQGCTQISGPRIEVPTPTPMIVYQAGDQYIKAVDLETLGQFMRGLNAGDPSPQPSVVALMEGLVLPIPQPTIDGFNDLGVNLEINPTCSFNGIYRDRRGNLIEPAEQSQAAIDCGCDYLEQFCSQLSGNAYTRCVFDGTLVANRVFRGGECGF